MQHDIKYRFYPSILNEFQTFINEDGYEDKEGVFKPFVTFESLIDSINRIPKVISTSMQQGIDFENDVISLAQGNPIVFENESDYNAKQYYEVLTEVVNRLPGFFTVQKQVSRQYKDILFYGKIDVAGSGRIIDLKYTGSYKFPQFKESYQNLYLWALSGLGFKSQEYIISNLKQVYVEYYGLDYNFSNLLIGMEHFKDFLESNREYITDKKIFSLIG